MLPDPNSAPKPIEKPPVNPSEALKYKNNGEYFFDMNRWLVFNHYNKYFVPSPLSTATTTTSQATGGTPIVDEMIENYNYAVGYQQNPFLWMTKTSSGGDIPAIFINGQKIRQLVDHIKGNVLETVKPMAKNITAESISKDAVINKKDIFAKIELAARINPIIEAAGGMPYQPMGAKNYSDKKDYNKAMNEARTQFEKDGTILAKNVYYTNNCQTKFVNDDAIAAIVANLSCTHITERDGQVIHESIPPYNAIYDFSSDGEYGENQRWGGYVVPITYEEALKESPDMPQEWKDELQKVFSSPSIEYNKWANFYNEPFQNVQWWYNDQKYFTKSVMYWIEKRDTRTQTKKTAFGGKKSRKIEDHKAYQIPNEDGTKNNVMGYDIKGDNEVYMVHYSIVYGNKYLAKYGYETFQVRPAFNKKMPQIPMFYYCPSKMAGYVRSIVSRLRQNQNELDRLAYKIQQLTANDLGKVFFIKGDKMTEGFTPRELVDDLKMFKISLLPPTGDAGSDQLGASDLITAVDMSNNQYLTSYIELKREQIQEMEAIVSIPAIALGQQRQVTGKGVQENTISQSTLSMLSFYEGLNEFYRRKLQYSVNKQKLVYATKPGTYILPISESQTEILKITKNGRFEDYMVYLQLNDSIDARNKNSLYQLLLGFSQNAGQNPLGAAQALLAGVKMLKFQTYNEGIEMLEHYVEDLTEQAKAASEQQSLIENQNMQYQTQSQQIAATQQQLSSIYEKLLTINLQGAWSVKNTEAKAAAQSEDEPIIQSAVQQQVQLDPRNQQQSGGG